MMETFLKELISSKNPICLYHASDMDGFGAAYIVYKLYKINTDKDLKCVPYTYSYTDKNLLKAIEGHDLVVFLDVAPVNVEVCKNLPKTFIFDHHITTEKKYKKSPKNVTYTFASVPTCWQVFYSYRYAEKFKKLTQIMSLLALYDVDMPDEVIKKWEIDTDLDTGYNARYLTYGLRAVTGMRDFSRFELYYVNNLIQFGKQAYNYARTTVSLIAEKYQIRKKLNGPFKSLNNYKYIAFNCPNIALPISTLLDDGYDAIVSFVISADMTIGVNMFSKNIDLLQIVPGSTGHPHEASMTVPRLC